MGERTKLYFNNGQISLVVSKYDLSIRKMDYADRYSMNRKEWDRRQLISPIDFNGRHQICSRRVQWLDGVIYCPKCDKVLEMPEF